MIVWRAQNLNVIENVHVNVNEHMNVKVDMW